jgi:hypothetical protein
LGENEIKLGKLESSRERLPVNLREASLRFWPAEVHPTLSHRSRVSTIIFHSQFHHLTLTTLTQNHQNLIQSMQINIARKKSSSFFFSCLGHNTTIATADYDLPRRFYFVCLQINSGERLINADEVNFHFLPFF